MDPLHSLGPLESYTSLTDDNLAGYFSNPLKQRHLQRMGLITREGHIVQESTVRLYNLHKEYEKKAAKDTAESLVQRSVELERKRRGELQKKLQILAKFDMAERVRTQCRHPVGAAVLDSTQLMSCSFITTINHYQDKLGLTDEQLPVFTKMMNQLAAPHSLSTNYVNPYTLFPHPPTQPHSLLYAGTVSAYANGRISRPPSSTRPQYPYHIRPAHARKRPNTAPARGVCHTLTHTLSEDKLHANIVLTLCYLGRQLHLATTSKQLSMIEVLQQHCGGNTLLLYRRKLKPRDQFILTSKRHIGMPFGLSLYIDGIIDTRLSACCEYKYQAGKLLGGKSAHFKLMKVEGGKPCFQCELDNERKMRADGKYRRKRSEKEVYEDCFTCKDDFLSSVEDNQQKSSPISVPTQSDDREEKKEEDIKEKREVEDNGYEYDDETFEDELEVTKVTSAKNIEQHYAEEEPESMHQEEKQEKEEVEKDEIKREVREDKETVKENNKEKEVENSSLSSVSETQSSIDEEVNKSSTSCSSSSYHSVLASSSGSEEDENQENLKEEIEIQNRKEKKDDKKARMELITGKKEVVKKKIQIDSSISEVSMSQLQTRAEPVLQESAASSIQLSPLSETLPPQSSIESSTFTTTGGVQGDSVSQNLQFSAHAAGVDESLTETKSEEGKVSQADGIHLHVPTAVDDGKATQAVEGVIQEANAEAVEPSSKQLFVKEDVSLVHKEANSSLVQERSESDVSLGLSLSTQEGAGREEDAIVTRGDTYSDDSGGAHTCINAMDGTEAEKKEIVPEMKEQVEASSVENLQEQVEQGKNEHHGGCTAVDNEEKASEMGQGMEDGNLNQQSTKNTKTEYIMALSDADTVEITDADKGERSKKIGSETNIQLEDKSKNKESAEGKEAVKEKLNPSEKVEEEKMDDEKRA